MQTCTRFCASASVFRPHVVIAGCNLTFSHPAAAAACLFVYGSEKAARCPPPERAEGPRAARPETSRGRRRARRGGGRALAAAAEAGVNSRVRQRALARGPSQLVAGTARWPARLDQRVRHFFWRGRGGRERMRRFRNSFGLPRLLFRQNFRPFLPHSPAQNGYRLTRKPDAVKSAWSSM